jgi:hypothetical protein
MKYLIPIFVLCFCLQARSQSTNLPLPTRQESQADSFLKFGDGESTLHPSKKSWVLFTALHAAAWSVLVYDVKTTHGVREHAGSEYPAVAAVTAMDVLTFKTMWQPLGCAPPLWVIQHYARDVVK